MGVGGTGQAVGRPWAAAVALNKARLGKPSSSKSFACKCAENSHAGL